MVQFLSLAALAGLSAVASAIPTIEVKGSKLFTSEGDQFYVKGKQIRRNAALYTVENR